MRTGSWQVRFTVSGRPGPGVLSIPVAATAMGTRKMQSGLGTLLSVLGILLVLGMVGIVGAAAREAQTPPGRLFRLRAESAPTSRWRLHSQYSRSA